ncbi:MAG: cysteine peptidase family C39 domain-containing protein [Chitinophagales bacterium]
MSFQNFGTKTETSATEQHNLKNTPKIPILQTNDAMDCGPTCLRMIAKHYGKHNSLQTLALQSNFK